jgi:hypothetical protein
MKKTALILCIVIICASCAPLEMRVAQLEKVPLPAPIPSFEPREGYFWGWIPEKDAWEQVKLGVAPPTHSILMKDLSVLPKGYVWGWDETQMRWVWLKVKDGGIVIKRIKYKDRLGNWYWKDVIGFLNKHSR